MSREPNPAQKAISESLEGFYVVDAGPGTGKTFTIVNRYVNIISKPEVEAKDILLLTFTRNAAAEMEERIREILSGRDFDKDTRLIQAGTFDSFCYSIVRESPETVSDFLGFDERLTRGAVLIENETLNREYFSDFFDEFNEERGEDYGDIAVIASTVPGDMYNLVDKLMSKGIVPLRKGWFGGNDGKDLLGDADKLYSLLEELNLNPKERKKRIGGIGKNIEKGDLYADGLTETSGETELSQEVLMSVSHDDRTGILRFVHDVYYEYLRRSVIDDRLTFGSTSVFAFLTLYSNGNVRERMSCKYVMIDEFQDTNETQMMISLMLLKEPNLCVVGDWKQGIYGFRFASIENIIDFEKKTVDIHRYLNDDTERIPFRIPEPVRLSLNVNYRSSREVIDASFKVLGIPGTDGEVVNLNPETVVYLEDGNKDIGDNTHVRYVQVPSESQAEETVSRIIDYVTGDYLICDGKELRPPKYGDIAVICKKGDMCRKVFEEANSRGVPAFLQGEVEIMSTREGKLLLAWLKYLNNKSDPWGLTGILSDMEYGMREIQYMLRSGEEAVPEEVVKMRKYLSRKKRRITDLISSVFSYYGLNNDITQAIISTLSSAHRSSLLTISDLIRIIETDIERKNAYAIDADLGVNAVTVQTMHKSKGLEYPIVIIPQLNGGVIPNTRGDKSVINFRETEGIRCFKEIVDVDGLRRIGKSWKSELARHAVKREYGEDRRTLFVAISRAKQYVTMICGNRPSGFIKGLSGEEYLGSIGYLEPSVGAAERFLSDRPVLKEFESRRRVLTVSEVMPFEEGGPAEGSDEVSGKGAEYGTRVHHIAESMARGIVPSKSDAGLPEVPKIEEILNSVRDADIVYSEIPCILPLDNIGVTLKGIMDLLVLYPDRAEVHDYKTDSDKRNLDAYKFQLSVYAHAVSGFYGKKTECILNFLSLDEEKVTERFDPIPIENIEKIVQGFYKGS